MKVTIHTDASYSRKYKIGGWACFIRARGIKIKQSGRIVMEHMGSSHAELVAILKALELLQKQADLSQCDITLKTDSKISINWIKTTSRKPHIIPDVKRVQALLSKVENYHLRYVPGHKYIKDDPVFGRSEYYVNNWCDEQAKAQTLLGKEEIWRKRDARQGKESTREKKNGQRHDKGYFDRRKIRGGTGYKRARKSIKI